MNWTGGGLSRSRNAKGTLSAKQKSYFAKARAKAQNGKSPRPGMQSFDLGDWKPTVKIASSPHSEGQILKQSSTQKTLDDFENVQPLVQRLNTLQPRHVSSKRKRTPLQSPNGHADQRRGEASNPIAIGSSQSCSSGFSSKSQTVEPQTRRSSSANNMDTTSFEAKRQRLLEMNDWVGLHRPLAEPVKMTFADPVDRDLIGRRRKIDHHPPTGGRRMASRGANPFVRKPGDIITAHDHYDSVDNISVRIGSAVDRSVGEGTARSSVGRRERSSVFSDELLDNGAPASSHRASVPSSAPTWPRSASVRSSDYGRRDVVTPSAFMDVSACESPLHSRGYVDGQSLFSSPVKEFEGFGDDDGRLQRSDFESPFEQPPTGSKLVFESSPRRYFPVPENGQAYSPVQDSPIIGTPPPTVLPDLSAAPESPGTPQRRTSSKRRGPKADDFDDRKFPRRVIERSPDQIKAATHAIENVDLFDGAPPKPGLPDEHYLLQVSKNSHTKMDNGEHHACRKIETQPQTLSTLTQEKNLEQRNSTLLHAQDYPRSSQDYSPPQINEADINHEPIKCSPPSIKPLDKETLEAPEDEEAAWRKFVFGDEASENEDSQHHGTASQDSCSPNDHPSFTQPSLIAEVGTSPLKQNPHLADETFEETTLSLSQASPRVQPNASNAKPQLPQPRAQRQDRPSSLVGEVSSSSSPPNSALPIFNISSDELHRSLDRVPFIQDTPPN